MSNKPSRHVLIVGGGIAGPALALFLQKAGISCAVYESHSYTEGVGGGLGLAPNGTKVLAALGLSDKLQEQASVITKYEIRNARGSLLGSIPLDAALYSQPSLALSRSLLFELLNEELRKQGIEHHFDKRLIEVWESEGRTFASFADGACVEGDLLVGADGARSTVRQQLLPDTHPQFTGLVGVGGFVPQSAVPSLTRETMTFVFGQRGFFGYSAADTGMVMWWTNRFQDQAFSATELRNVDSKEWKRQLSEQFADYHDPIPSLISSTNELMLMNVTDVQSLPVWHKGRIMLIGDAAHAVSPNSGQGASLALEDAMLLARHLRDCDDYRTAYRQFEHERKPRAEKVVAEGRRRGLDKTIVGPLRQWFREQLISLFFRLSKGRTERWLYDYNIEW